MATLTVLQVVLAVVANGVLGALWYNESTLSPLWRRAHGLTEAQAKKINSGILPIPVSMLAGLVQTLVADFILTGAGVAAEAGVDGLRAQLSVLATVWVAFTFLDMASHQVFITPAWITSSLIDSSLHLFQLAAFVLIRTYV